MGLRKGISQSPKGKRKQKVTQPCAESMPILAFQPVLWMGMLVPLSFSVGFFLAVVLIPYLGKPFE
jgi:hypothetical protein